MSPESAKRAGCIAGNAVVIDFFVEAIEQRPKISFDEAIFQFEQAGGEFADLGQFARSKTRTPEGYGEMVRECFADAKRRVEQVQHAERDRVPLHLGDEPRADAAALLLLAHHAEGHLEEAARAVRLEHLRWRAHGAATPVVNPVRRAHWGPWEARRVWALRGARSRRARAAPRPSSGAARSTGGRARRRAWPRWCAR